MRFAMRRGLMPRHSPSFYNFRALNKIPWSRWPFHNAINLCYLWLLRKGSKNNTQEDPKMLWAYYLKLFRSAHHACEVNPCHARSRWTAIKPRVSHKDSDKFVLGATAIDHLHIIYLWREALWWLAAAAAVLLSYTPETTMAAR